MRRVPITGRSAPPKRKSVRARVPESSVGKAVKAGNFGNRKMKRERRMRGSPAGIGALGGFRAFEEEAFDQGFG